MLVLIGLNIGNAYAETDSDSAVKISFLYNFFKFIDWPQSADTSGGYRLCTTSGESLGNNLLELQDKTINNIPLSIKRGVSGKELKNCHMVFIVAEEDTGKYISDLQGLAVVTVSDEPDFINQGAFLASFRTMIVSLLKSILALRTLPAFTSTPECLNWRKRSKVKNEGDCLQTHYGTRKIHP